MIWKVPPVIKVYEALGSIGDGRIEILSDELARVYSSSRQKFYSVQYDESKNAIMANDNGSYWQGYLGYPSIALLMQKGVLPFEEEYTRTLGGIAWKDINTKFQNDFVATKKYVDQTLLSKGINLEALAEYCERVLRAIEMHGFKFLGNKQLPPLGY